MVRLHPYYHALSSALKHGGQWKDYIEIHNWFDETKSSMSDVRHRALRHHSEGIFLCERIHGLTLEIKLNELPAISVKNIPVRLIGEQHVIEDLGFIPTVKDYLKEMKVTPWMAKQPMETKKLKDKLEFAEWKKGAIETR